MIDLHIESLLNEHRKTPFKFGTFDCCQFAAAAMSRIHGAQIKLPKYRTKRGAVRAVASLGGYAMALQNAGFKRLDCALNAKRGDVVIIKNDCPIFTQALALCTGEKSHTTGTIGLMAIAQNQWLEAWCFNG